MKRFTRASSFGWVVIAIAIGGLAASSAPHALLRRVVAGSDCGRFTEPSVDVVATPDTEYNGTDGESVDTIDVSDRSLGELLLRVQAARQAQVDAAARSVELAGEKGAAAGGTVLATISFNGTRTVDEGIAFASRFGLVPRAISHGFLTTNHLFVGEIPTTEGGLPRPSEVVAQEYRDNVALQLAEARRLVAGGPEDSRTAVLVDVEARARAAAVEGPRVIGLVVEGTVAQLSAVARTARDVIVNVTPAGCDTQHAIVPEAWVPMVAHQLTDLPETAHAPVIGSSPGPEGRS